MKLSKYTIPILSAIALGLASCATHDTATQAPKPKNGIAEYQQIAKDAHKSVQSAEQALSRLSAQTGPVSEKTARKFSEAVEHLESESVQVRARSQAMQARGDAYFQHWHENLARMTDPQVRQLATEHHADLEAGFGRIKEASHETRKVFTEFLAGMRKLRNEVEKNPDALSTAPMQELAKTTAAQGQQVELKLKGIRDELTAMKQMLTPGKATASL